MNKGFLLILALLLGCLLLIYLLPTETHGDQTTVASPVVTKDQPLQTANNFFSWPAIKPAPEKKLLPINVVVIPPILQPRQQDNPGDRTSPGLGIEVCKFK